MSSKGTPRVTIRIPDAIRSAIEDELDRRNALSSVFEPWKMSDWILAAVLESLNHRRRGRKQSGTWTMETAKDGLQRPVFSPEQKEVMP